MGSKSKAPESPDYAGAARAQGVANAEAARVSGKLSNPNFTNPLGSREVTYGFNPSEYLRLNPDVAADVGFRANPLMHWQQYGQFEGRQGGGDPDQVFVKDSLTPAGQARFDQEQRIIGNLGNVAESGLDRVGKAMATPFSLSSADAIQDKAEKAIMSRLEPTLEKDREALRSQLVNSGFRIGTDAYNKAMQRADQQANDARTQAVVQALSTRPQVIQEESFIRQLPLNELNALRSGSQVSMPQFQAYQGKDVAPAPIFWATQAQGQWDANAYNQRVAQDNAMIGGAFDLGSSVMGASKKPWWM